MKFNVDHFKRMTVADLKNLEQNISMWFHLKDRQRSVAATALGLRKSLAPKPTGFTCQRASNLTERHSKAVLDCRENLRLTTAVKDLMPSAGTTVRDAAGAAKKPMLEVSIKKRYGVIAPKRNDVGIIESSILKKDIRTSVKEREIIKERTGALTCNVVPQAASPKTRGLEERPGAVDDKRATDVNANTLPKKSLPVSIPPSKGKRFSKPVPLRRIVILREHHKKCEIRIRQLEEKTSRLRQQKNELQQRSNAVYGSC